MGGTKIDHTFSLNPDHLSFLQEMTDTYNLPDEQKALRVLLDYAMHEADRDTIFEDFRCNHCG